MRGLRTLSLAALAWMTLAAPAQGGAVDDALDKVLPDLIEIRHTIHRNPELGFREHQTAALVVEHLRKAGFTEIRTGVAETGVVAILRGGRPGPSVAVRADMDALPVTEATALPFRSTRRDTYQGQEVGVAHACGHDIHVASLWRRGLHRELPTQRFRWLRRASWKIPGPR